MIISDLGKLTNNTTAIQLQVTTMTTEEQIFGNPDLARLVCSYMSSIHEAAEEGNLGVVQILCSIPGAEPWANRNYALSMAAYKGHLHVVQYLWTQIKDFVPPTEQTDPDTDPWVLQENYEQAIGAAADEGHLPVVEFLCSVVVFKPKYEHNRAFRGAIENGHLQVVRFLWTQIDHNDKTYNPITIMKLAASYGHVSVITFLWSVIPNASFLVGDWALDTATMAGHLDAVKFLCSVIDFKNQPRLLNMAIDTAMRYAHPHVVAYLKTV